MQSRTSPLTHAHKAAIGDRRARRCLVATLACLLALLPLAGVYAQDSGVYRTPPDRTPAAMSAAAASEAAPDAIDAPPGYIPPGNLIVDTDAGVDDAAALGWLLTQTAQVNLLAVTTVAGNTTVDNATKNVLALLLSNGWQPGSAPEVWMGAAKPLNEKLSSTGKLIHGTDGLGYARYLFEDSAPGVLDQLLAATPTDVRSFYCSHAPTANDEPITILALGPLTNIATAIKKCPNEMRRYQYVVLGGNRGLGNQTPSAEYNFWQDPDAAQLVFSAGIEQILIVPTDAFAKFRLFFGDVFLLANEDQAPLAQLVGAALGWYVGLFSGGVDGIPVSVPDPTAAMVAVYPQVFAPYSYGAIEAGLVEIEKSPQPEYLRGTSTIGIYNYNEPLTMVAKDKAASAFYDELLDGVTTVAEAQAKIPEWQAALYELYAQHGPNAQVVLYPDGELMRNCFLQAFGATGYAGEEVCPLAAAVVGAGAGPGPADPAPALYLPMMSAD